MPQKKPGFLEGLKGLFGGKKDSEPGEETSLLRPATTASNQPALRTAEKTDAFEGTEGLHSSPEPSSTPSFRKTSDGFGDVPESLSTSQTPTSQPRFRSGSDGFDGTDLGSLSTSGPPSSTPALRKKPDSFESTEEIPPAAPKNPIPPKKVDPNKRAIRCVDCDETLYVSSHARSTQCGDCGAWVNLEDVVLDTPRREDVKTRGNILINKKGALTASNIVCDNLKVLGRISGRIDCAGNAFFRSSGKVIGSMRCKHLEVHRDSNLQFFPGIRAESAEIHGQIMGDLICEGTIKIFKTGAVVGDCTAPAINLEDGGTLSGQMRIMRPDSELHAEYERRAQEAHQELEEQQGEEEDSEAENTSSEEKAADSEKPSSEGPDIFPAKEDLEAKKTPDSEPETDSKDDSESDDSDEDPKTS